MSDTGSPLEARREVEYSRVLRLDSYFEPSWNDIDNADAILRLTARPVSIGEVLAAADHVPRALETVLHLLATSLLTRVGTAELSDGSVIVATDRRIR